MTEKKFNPDLWKPLCIKPVEARKVIQPGKLNSFLDYQAPEDRYEVRGIMPKAPEYPERAELNIGRRHSFLGYLD